MMIKTEELFHFVESLQFDGCIEEYQISFTHFVIIKKMWFHSTLEPVLIKDQFMINIFKYIW